MAPLNKSLVLVTQPVLTLLAEGIDPRQFCKQVVMEVDPVEPKDYIMGIPHPPNVPNNVGPEAWRVVLAIENMGMRITKVGQPIRNGQIVCDEIYFEGNDKFSGTFTVWRADSGHTTHSVSYHVYKGSMNWIKFPAENNEDISALLRMLSWSYRIALPRIVFRPTKDAERQLMAMRNKFVDSMIREAKEPTPKDFIMAQQTLIGYRIRRPSQTTQWSGSNRGYEWAILADVPGKPGEMQWLWHHDPEFAAIFSPVETDAIMAHPTAHEAVRIPALSDNPKYMQAESLEQELVKASRGIKHSGDYGKLYFHPGTKRVHWTAADSDSTDNGYTDTRDIKKMLDLDGVSHVEIGDEWSPKEEDGWIRLDDSLTPGEDLATSLLLESPQFKTLKQHRQSLSAEENRQSDGEPIWKAVVDGTTWYCSNTHRCYQAHKKISDAVKAYREVVEPSG